MVFQTNEFVLEKKHDMNTLSISVPYEYAANLVNLNWRDILFAIDQGFFSPEAAIDHAIILMSEEKDANPEILELALIDSHESIHPYIDILAASDDSEYMNTKDKFLYVLLQFIYDNRDKYADPFSIVECIYADFDYPEEISTFVRYMPADHLPCASLGAGNEHLLNSWNEYLERQRVIMK